MLDSASRRVASALRALGSLLPRAPERRRATRRVIRPWHEDALRTYPTIGLTPARALALLQQADQGQPAGLFELFDEMRQKWPRLAAVENTRRLALTGLDWEIIPAPGGVADAAPRASADRAADFCRQTLDELERFPETLDHLATAPAYGVAVAELVWERGRLIDVVPVPPARLVADPQEPWRLRVRTADDPHLGVPLDVAPAKWILHKPRATPGRLFDGGLLRASLLLFVAQNLSFKDWLIFSQVAGMPLRVAQFDAGVPEEDRQTIVDLLTHLGTDAVAAFSKNIDLKFIEPARAGSEPYRSIQDYCNTEVTILWLGQHLTTDLRGTGSRAAAEVHDRIREDLLVDDMADEAHTLRRALLAPLARARFGDDVPVPRFRRALVQSVDTKALADTLAIAVNELGLAVPERWVRQALGVPQPQAGEPVLTGRDRS